MVSLGSDANGMPSLLQGGRQSEHRNQITEAALTDEKKIGHVIRVFVVLRF